jgi:protein-S-isoprenylcysteine O-methyltransferase Ste14
MGENMAHFTSSKILLVSTIAAYCLIGIEIIIMISPFALYFYSVYAPVLEFLSSSSYLSWTTEFFLPHMVFTHDPVIVAISYFQVLLVVGLVLFFSAAIPLYYGRFTNKGVVLFSFYAKIRHPQYLFLAISGFGLLLYWPRFLILIMYVTMLFVYYFLARNEEWRMKQEVPGEYEKYMENTPMFLPGEPGGKVYNFLFSWIQPKWLGLFVMYCLVLVLSVSLAMGLRSYTVSRLQAVSLDNLTLLSVFPRPIDEVSDMYRMVVASDEFQKAVAEGEQTNLAYIFPGDFFLTALVTDKDRRFSEDIVERFPEVLEWHKHKFSGGLGKFFRIFNNYIRTLGSVETDYDVDRLVFVRVEDAQGKLLPADELFAIGARRRPVLIVDVDSFDHKILSVISASGQHKWGTMPMPSF